jgi:hypothetical protein
MITMECKKCKPTVIKAHMTALNLNNFKMIGAMGLKITVSRSA